MRNSVIFLFAVVVLLQSCKDPSLEDYKNERKELKKELKEVQAVIDSLSGDKDEGNATPVYADTLEKKPFSSYVNVYGSVESGSNVLVIPEAAGVIKNIYVKEGQKVNKGQTLASVDASVIRQNIEEVKSRLELAEKLFEKQQNLYEKNVGSEVQYLEVKNRKEVLERQLETLKAQLYKTTVKSPVAGKVDEIFPKEGEMASMSSPLMRIVNTRKGFYIEAEVSESFFTKIKEGDTVQIDFNTLGIKTNAVISYRGNYINPANRSFKIRASLDDKYEYAPNLLGVIKIRDEYKPAEITVPLGAIKSDINGHYVYVIKKGKHLYAEKKYIEMGPVSENYAVVSGLDEGDVLVTEAVWNRLSSKENEVKVVSDMKILN